MERNDQALNPAREWQKIVAPYRGPNTKRSIIQVSLTLAAFFLLWAAMFWSLRVSYALTLLLAVPAAGFLVRLFMIQHDCGHGSYFRSRRARDGVGFALGVLTLTPYVYWRKTHAYHHAHSGNLDFRGFGDIATLTAREYRALPLRRRVSYRLYRNPFIMLGLGPFFQFVIKHRFPWDAPRSWKQAWTGVWWTNACLAAIVAIMAMTIGLGPFLMVHAPVTLLASSIGLWLFYVQHQFEDTYWRSRSEWNALDASLQGSSHLVLPKPLQWITASIGLHHIHHMDSLIPNYRLQDCLEATPELQRATKITVADSWRLLRLALWDEERKRLIRFSELAPDHS